MQEPGLRAAYLLDVGEKGDDVVARDGLDLLDPGGVDQPGAVGGDGGGSGCGPVRPGWRRSRPWPRRRRARRRARCRAGSRVRRSPPSRGGCSEGSCGARADDGDGGRHSSGGPGGRGTAAPEAVLVFWFAPGMEQRWFSPMPPSTPRSSGASVFGRLAAAGRARPAGRRRALVLSPCACCSTSSRATSGAARRAPSPATPWRARWPGPPSRPATTGPCRRPSGPFFYLPFEHSEDLADQERCMTLMRGLGRRRAARLRAAPPRRDRPLRPLPPPQRDPRPGEHGGGGRVPAAAGLVVLSQAARSGRPCSAGCAWRERHRHLLANEPRSLARRIPAAGLRARTWPPRPPARRAADRPCARRRRTAGPSCRRAGRSRCPPTPRPRSQARACGSASTCSRARSAKARLRAAEREHQPRPRARGSGSCSRAARPPPRTGRRSRAESRRLRYWNGGWSGSSSTSARRTMRNPSSARSIPRAMGKLRSNRAVDQRVIGG